MSNPLLPYFLQIVHRGEVQGRTELKKKQKWWSQTLVSILKGRAL
jgi:hypothetical protein